MVCVPNRYRYGWVVPFLCLYLIWRKAESRKQKAEEELQAEVTTGARDNRTAGQRDHGTTGQRGEGHEVGGPWSVVSGPFILWSLALCALLYAPTRFLHEANPIWRLTSLLWTLEVIGITLLTMCLLRGPWSVIRGPSSSGPAVPSASHLPSSRSPFQLSAFNFSDVVFPLCFFLVAVPWPSGLESIVTQSLMRLNVATTIELLGLFGIPAVQQGNVIEIGTGVVGIDDACSGIRSFQATLMISLFFGELYALGAVRRALCVFAGFALAFLFNVGRTLLLTWIASAKGVGAIASWHDPAGVTILVGCFLCLWLIARALQKSESRKQKAQLGTTGPPDHKTTGLEVSGQRSEGGGQWSGFSGQRVAQASLPASSASVPASPNPSAESEQGSRGRSPSRGPVVSWSCGLALPCSLLAWLLLVEVGTELWYRSHERAKVGSTGWSVQRLAQSPTYQEVEIPPRIRGQFQADEGTHARWEDGSGNAWQLYYFRWLPAHSLKGRVAIQLAKVHGPEICLPAAGMTLISSLGVITVPIAGMELAMQQYVFRAEGRLLHVFYGIYEDPSESAKLANPRQDSSSRVAAALAGSRNYGQRFFEVAVSGYARPEDARAALIQELGKVIKVE